MPHKNFYISLIRHTEFDPGSGSLTPGGRDMVGEIALHFSPEHGRTPLARLEKALRPPRIDVIAHSASDRTAAVAEILGTSLRSGQIARLGALEILAERHYPEYYDAMSSGGMNQIDYRDFRGLEALLATLRDLPVQHIALVTHAPAMRALSLAMLGKRTNCGVSCATADFYQVEHDLRAEKKQYGHTITFTAQNWQDFLGRAKLVLGPVVPGAMTPSPQTDIRTRVLSQIKDLQAAK